jgi:hypothetical protein
MVEFGGVLVLALVVPFPTPPYINGRRGSVHFTVRTSPSVQRKYITKMAYAMIFDGHLSEVEFFASKAVTAIASIPM